MQKDDLVYVGHMLDMANPPAAHPGARNLPSPSRGDEDRREL